MELCSAGLLIFLSSQTSTGVGDFDVELLGAFHNLDALFGADIVSNFGGIRSVVHQQKVQIANVGDDDTLESIGAHVARLGVGTVSDLWHGLLALEATADTIVNTFGFSPGRL